MEKIDAAVVKDARDFVEVLYKNIPNEMAYHRADHTRGVVDAVQKIGENSGLSEDDLNLAKLCAWFHDVGYVKSYDNPEKASVKIAEEFLAAQNVENDVIELVKDAIFATRIPQSPKNKISQVLCDADMYHLASPDYFERIEALRSEFKWAENRKISKTEFHTRSVTLFSNHHYHTDYGKTVLQKGKEKNLALIEKKIAKKQKKQLNEQNTDIKKPKKVIKPKRYSRGVESMFRLTARNQISLSSIADNKSNILISVNTIIISIILSVLVSRFSEYPQLILPSIAFLMVSLVTIIFAILSTRPNISSGRFTKEDIEKKKVNLLFFGNFYDMSLDDYEWALVEMMNDDDYLYATMIKDQHSLGQVLAKKYKLLRKAYNFFMFGLVFAVLVYVVSFLNI